MPKWGEVRQSWKWLCDNLTDDEPVVFKMPRREAKKRIANKEKRHRIVLVTDDQNYSEFHQIRESWLSMLGENPTMFLHALIEAMRSFDLREWRNGE